MEPEAVYSYEDRVIGSTSYYYDDKDGNPVREFLAPDGKWHVARWYPTAPSASRTPPPAAGPRHQRVGEGNGVEPDIYFPYEDLETGHPMRCYYDRYGQVVHEYFETPEGDGPERSKYIRMLNMAGTRVKGGSAPAQPVATATAPAPARPVGAAPAMASAWPDAQPDQWQERAAEMTVTFVMQDLKMSERPFVRWYGDQERKETKSGRALGYCADDGKTISLWVGNDLQACINVAAHEMYHASLRRFGPLEHTQEEEVAALAYGDAVGRLRTRFTEHGDYFYSP